MKHSIVYRICRFLLWLLCVTQDRADFAGRKPLLVLVGGEGTGGFPNYLKDVLGRSRLNAMQYYQFYGVASSGRTRFTICVDAFCPSAFVNYNRFLFLVAT